jgi:hypothetical protein
MFDFRICHLFISINKFLDTKLRNKKKTMSVNEEII